MREVSLGKVTDHHPPIRAEAAFATPLPPVLSNLPQVGIWLENSQLVKTVFF